MILLIDNYDSFTYNIADYLLQIETDVLVRRNDELSIAEIEQLSPKAIVISPGPKKPIDAGITMELIKHFHTSIPLLGICLGYQAIGNFFGCTLIKSPVPVHGKTSTISHTGTGIFQDIRQKIEVMRYHSLNLAGFPAILEVTATTVEAEPMAFSHTSLPITGVQFHPESILTPDGMSMLKNWYRMINH